MCHQSVGLIARQLEAAGIATLCMSSARSITRSVNPPRAVYLDYPLGHTTGRAHDVEEQRTIMDDALRHFEEMTVPGTIETLDYAWAEDDDWKDGVMRPSGDGHGDDRVERVDTPQYQSETDASAAADVLAHGGCRTCVWLE